MTLQVTPRDKKLLLACGTVLGVYLLIVFALQPIFAEQQRIDRQIQNKIQFITKYYEILNQKSYYEAKNKTNQQNRVALGQKFLNETKPGLAAASLQKILEGFAQRSGVTVEQVRVEKNKILEETPAVPIEMSIRSNLRSLTQFISLLENFEKFLLVEEIVIRRINKSDPEELQTRILINGFIQEDKPAPQNT